MAALQQLCNGGCAARECIVGRWCHNNRPPAAQQAFGGQRDRGGADARRQHGHGGAGGRGDDQRLRQPFGAKRLDLLQGGQRRFAGQLPQLVAQIFGGAEAGIQRGGAAA